MVTLCGGQPIGPQIGSLEHGAHVVVGTPGRIKDHLRKENPVAVPASVPWCLDEADRMLEMGFVDDMETIIAADPGYPPDPALFSATLPDDIQALSHRFQQSACTQVSVEALHE